MKKFLGVAASTVMLSAGMAAFAASPASADCPYTGCIPTSTEVDAPAEVERGDSARICVKVRTDGNGQPKGTVALTVRRAKGDFKWQDIKKYNDNRECFTTPDLRQRGNYIVKARFTRNPNGSWAPSAGYDEFKVVRRG